MVFRISALALAFAIAYAFDSSKGSADAVVDLGYGVSRRPLTVALININKILYPTKTLTHNTRIAPPTILIDPMSF